MQIQPVSEASYNQAKMTLDLMRGELLFYREELPKLKAEYQAQIDTLVAANTQLNENETQLKEKIKELELLINATQSTSIRGGAIQAGER